jgi:hypothetical protein
VADRPRSQTGQHAAEDATKFSDGLKKDCEQRVRAALSERKGPYHTAAHTTPHTTLHLNKKQSGPQTEKVTSARPGAATSHSIAHLGVDQHVTYVLEEEFISR